MCGAPVKESQPNPFFDNFLSIAAAGKLEELSHTLDVARELAVVAVVTGKGPQKSMYEERMR